MIADFGALATLLSLPFHLGQSVFGPLANRIDWVPTGHGNQIRLGRAPANGAHREDNLQDKRRILPLAQPDDGLDRARLTNGYQAADRAQHQLLALLLLQQLAKGLHAD